MDTRRVALATLVCGTLDIGYAMVSTMLAGGPVAAMLRGVASGPFGSGARHWGAPGAFLGLSVHFAIMAAMVAAYFAFATRTRLGSLSPWLSGTAYGLGLYLFMNMIVLPLRFQGFDPLSDPEKAALALFPHVAFVGLPLAFMARSREPVPSR